MNRLKRLYIDFIEGEQRVVTITFIGLLILIAMIACLTLSVTGSDEVTHNFSDKIMRFHVVANSDSTEDQLLKQQVKDEVIAYMEPLLKGSSNIEETKDIIEECLPLIKEVAEEVVDKWNKDYDIYVALDEANFPTKSYGDVVLPAGEYEACRIIIGEGKGENWWCVMFPPLCYLDASTGVVPLEGKEQLQQELTEEQYRLITDKSKPYQVRFKFIDSINSFFNRENYKEIR